MVVSQEMQRGSGWDASPTIWTSANSWGNWLGPTHIKGGEAQAIHGSSCQILFKTPYASFLPLSDGDECLKGKAAVVNFRYFLLKQVLGRGVVAPSFAARGTLLIWDSVIHALVTNCPNYDFPIYLLRFFFFTKKEVVQGEKWIDKLLSKIRKDPQSTAPKQVDRSQGSLT